MAWFAIPYSSKPTLLHSKVDSLELICSMQSDLDKDPLLKGRLISLTRVDGHARWVSQAVLDLMPDLPEKVGGGLIVRDKQGNPTGIHCNTELIINKLIIGQRYLCRQRNEFDSNAAME